MPKNSVETPLRRCLISVADASEYADVSTKTVRRWIAAGQLPAYRVGPRLLKVDLNELEAILRPIATAGGGR